jgi:peroxiredoxin
MAAKESRMLPLGTSAPPFSLPDASGRHYTLDDFADCAGLLVAFICNHCPYVKHILDGFIAFARDYGPKGLAVVAINPNDASRYPDDSPESMRELAARKRLSFPYLIDEMQDIAKAYGAICTPDFFLFDAERRLLYRGQFDASRPGNAQPVTGSDLRAAADALLAGRAIERQVPSIGCSIKWKPGRAPNWA